ncbi:hypothetical protein SCHPADRAFT_512947 [Schizopora paradoxa]|uniref:Uncharacterized protein n=1 Tax=Schizopora paradoxa TaxID=27342 RepID=A0A0H2RM58_9AGAM|nr:hypothetical protein SCHPADRAFT_512947 [Schizopora paradoxa]
MGAAWMTAALFLRRSRPQRRESRLRRCQYEARRSGEPAYSLRAATTHELPSLSAFQMQAAIEIPIMSPILQGVQQRSQETLAAISSGKQAEQSRKSVVVVYCVVHAIEGITWAVTWPVLQGPWTAGVLGARRRAV